MADVQTATPSTTTTSTPSASSTSTAAPSTTAATPQTTTSPTPADRPSFGVALKTAFEQVEAERKATSTPAPVATAETQTETPIAAADATTTQPQKLTGQIATADHVKAVENARIRGRQDAEATFRQQYGEPQAVSDVMRWARTAATDRKGFLRSVITEAANDPELATELRSLAGRTLSGYRGQAQPVDAPAPAFVDPDFRDDSGNEFFSAKTMRANLEALAAQLRQEMQPLQQEVAQTKEQRVALQARARAEQRTAQVKETFATHLTDARSTWPHFKDHEAVIKQALAAEPLTDGHPSSEALLLHKVYTRIVGPKLSQLEQERVQKDMQRRAAGSSLNPANTGAPSGIPKNVQAKHGGTIGESLRWATRLTGGR